MKMITGRKDEDMSKLECKYCAMESEQRSEMNTEWYGHIMCRGHCVVKGLDILT
jgi:hypothetical protein